MRLLSFRIFIRLTIGIILTVGISLKLNKLSGVKKPSFIKRLLEGEVISLSDGEPIYSNTAHDVCADRVFNSLSLEVEIIKAELDKEVKA